MMREEDITRNMLERIRSFQKDSVTQYAILTEEAKEKKSKAIAITDDPRFGQNVLTNQINQFRSSVDGGAEFSKPSEDVSSCPLIYLPDTGNLVFSGVIPSMNNLKWQFVLKTSTGCGCFIWSDGMILSKENLQTINKLYGFFENWKESWLMESAELEKMAEAINNKL